MDTMSSPVLFLFEDNVVLFWSSVFNDTDFLAIELIILSPISLAWSTSAESTSFSVMILLIPWFHWFNGFLCKRQVSTVFMLWSLIILACKASLWLLPAISPRFVTILLLALTSPHEGIDSSYEVMSFCETATRFQEFSPFQSWDLRICLSKTYHLAFEGFEHLDIPGRMATGKCCWCRTPCREPDRI